VKLQKLLGGTLGASQAIGELISVLGSFGSKEISDSPIILISCSLFGFKTVSGPESYKNNALLDENDN
jgi:hypothetical protein